VVTHLTSGAVTLAEAPVDGDDPLLVDAVAGLFASDPVTGVRGAVGAAGRLPGSAGDRIYVTSRSEARIQTLTVVRPEGSRFPTIVPGDFFFLTGGVQPSDDSRGIAFSPDGNRAFIINRDPPILHVVDTSMSELGTPRNEFIGGIELCREASNLIVGDVGRGTRVYVACFRDGQVWSIDPEGFVVEAITDVGRGPHAVAVSARHGLLFVTNFLENTIAVIDVSPGSITESRVVLRLGRAGDDGGS
jgi:DNA-binding beta-propeller fold protein YncE